ncbi:hypothetical protein [Saccharothrix sp.]|uniref:hypothetical protein n=1 Tax=Saccharothrix sp. TaxID=1873460 RepID=UPI0028127216|nr:hypothetical protein [Saccharothrix sp.]
MHTVVGDDVPTALLKFARGVNATQLVLGTPRRSRLAQVFDEGIGAAVLQASGPIDMHMVTHHEARRGVWWRIGRNPVIGALTRSHRIAGWALALVLPAACAAVGVVLRERIELSTALAMVIVALQAKGRGRAMPSPVLGASPDALHDLVTEAFPTWRCGR